MSTQDLQQLQQRIYALELQVNQLTSPTSEAVSTIKEPAGQALVISSFIAYNRYSETVYVALRDPRDPGYWEVTGTESIFSWNQLLDFMCDLGEEPQKTLNSWTILDGGDW